jgi:hypothetical protein
MKSLIVLWSKMAKESAIRCDTCTTKDLETVLRRIKHEGLSFLTITLATFGKDFEKSLDQGYVDRSLFQGFSWTAGLPQFLGGFLDLVFDRSDGVLLDVPDIDAIIAIRQLTLMFSKINIPCTRARNVAAMSQYIKCEQEVRRNDISLNAADMQRFRRISRLLFSSAFTRMDSDIYRGNVVPKHGPGATADKLRGNSKYRQSTWPRRLETIFPMGEFLLPSWSYYDQLESVDLLEPGAEIPVKVITVPKTQKTPRIIAIEPTAMQYAQQGVLEVMLQHIWNDNVISNMIGFLDQTINQRLAREGSKFGSLATLDLSEASDRVSNQLVRAMLQDHFWLHEAVDACRSRKADVPGHGVVRLSKFASMGSALCFPIEAMIFLIMIFIGIEKGLNTQLTKHTVKQYLGKVHVYGDDIIVPADCVPNVVETLQTFGFVVNSGKSFWTGKFRESCGKEYYDNNDVSIVKVRRMFPTQLGHVQEIISTVSLRNQLYKAGYWQTVKWLDSKIEDVIRHFPTVLESSPVLGRHSFLGYCQERLGRDLHNPQVKGYVVSPQLHRDYLDGEGALLKFFLKRGSLPAADRKHLERVVRPHAVNIKLRWASAI